ncbi:coiled-coil domain-containing protein [Lacrimispora brassicae]
MQLKDLGNLPNIIENLNSSSNIADYFNSLNLSMQKCVLTSDKLNQSQLELILAGTVFQENSNGIKATVSGLSKAELEAAVQTTSFSTAEKGAAIATSGFSTALKGLWATIAANPLLGIGIAITAGSAAWNFYKQSAEKARQETSAAADAYLEVSSSVNDYAGKYKALYDELTNANTTEERQLEIKSDLLSLQQELNDKYGDEYGHLNLVTDAYKDQTEAIKNYNKAAAQRYLNEHKEGFKTAEEKMTLSRTYFLGNDIGTYSESGSKILDIAKNYEDFGIAADPNESTGTFSIILNADASKANTVINDFMTEIGSLEESFGKDDPFISTVIDMSSDSLRKSMETLDKYEKDFSTGLMMEIATNGKLSDGYNKAAGAVEAYNNALISGDETKILSAKDHLNQIKNSIDLTSDNWKRFGSVMTDIFNQADTRLYDFRDAFASNENNLTTYARALQGKTREELLSMEQDKAGADFNKLLESSKEYDLSVNQIIDELVRLKIVQEAAAKSGEAAFAPLSKQDLTAKINSLSGGFESLNKISNSIKGENPFDYVLLDDKKFKDNFSDLKDTYTNFVETISSSPKDINATQSAFNELVTAWIDSSGVLNNLTEENAKLAATMLENMGVTNAEEVVMSRLIILQEHLAAQKAYTAEMSYSLANATADEIPNILEEATQSEIAKVALAGLAIEKQLFNGHALDTSGDIENILSLVGIIGTANTALKNLYILKSGGNLGGRIDKEAYDKIQTDALQELDVAIKESSIYKGKGSATNASYGNGTQANKSTNGSGTSGNEKANITKEFDFVERRLKLFEDKRAELKEKSNNTYIDFLGITQSDFDRAKELLTSDIANMTTGADELFAIVQRTGLTMAELHTLVSTGNPSESKENYLSQLLELDKTMLSDYEGSVQKYQDKYKETLIGIPPQYQEKIESGSISIDSLSGEETEKVQAAINAYDKLKEAIKKQTNFEKEYIADTIAPYENKVIAIENTNKQFENSNSLLEKQMEYYRSAGEIVNSSVLEALVGNTASQIENVEKILKTRRAQLNNLLTSGKVSKDSEEYIEIKNKINDAEVSLFELKKQQEEYNHQLKQLPINNLGVVISMYNDINSAISNWGAEIEASGKKLDSEYYQKMISNGAEIINQYKKQASLIEDVMGEYKTGSDNWNELYSQLQSVNSEMSSMVQNLHKWNEELLKMPMENINNYSSELQKVADGLSSVKNEYETVISAVTGAINDEIQKINETKEAYETSLNVQKKAIQDKLDLLDKQNEKLKLQTNLEQALYDLQVANTQKTERVIRNGEQVYESNADNIRNAQNAVHDARLDVEKYNLQSQMDKLDEALENYNKKCEEQLENLNKQSEKWSEIVEKITQAQNEIKAAEILGKDWKDKVISGNDSGIYDMFKNMYQANADQLKQYEEQINATNNIYSLLEEYIASYKNGTLSYDEAMNGMNDLLKQLNQVMSASSNLQNIYDYLGSVNNTGANANDVLNGIQKGLADTASELMKSFEQYNKNSGIISEYTSSWQQLTNNVSSMLSVLKEVRDNLKNGYDRDDDDDDDDGAPFRKGSEGYVDSGPGAYKDGIEKGIVGTNSKEEVETKLKLLGLKALAPDELPSILHKGEAIFNSEQQEMLLDNFSTAYGVIPDFPDHGKVLGGFILNNEIPSVQNFQFGDINIQECNDSDCLAEGILNGGLRSAMLQQSGKI